MAPVAAPERPEPAVAAPPAAEASVPRGTWHAAARRLRLVDPAMHGAWIVPLRPERDEDGVLTLRAPTRFAAHYVETRLMRPLAEAVEAEMGPRRRIVVAGPPG
jgi:hypothetical protein